jgi:hypothetical protein
VIWNLDARDGVDRLTDGSVQLLWTDPPFGTNKRQRLQSTRGTDLAYADVAPSAAQALIVDVIERAAPKLAPEAVVALCPSSA